MKKIILTSVFCLMAFVSISAEQYNYYLNIKFKGSETVFMAVPLMKMPTFTYEYDDDTATNVLALSISNAHKPVNFFDLSNNYVFSYSKEKKTPSSILSAIANSGFSKNDDIVTVNGLTANEMVTVYGANGAKLADAAADSNGVVVFDISSMPKGVVIIKSKDASFKLAH